MGTNACFCRDLIVCERDDDVVVFVARWRCHWEGGRFESDLARWSIGRRGRWLCIVGNVATVAAMCRGRRSQSGCADRVG